MIKLACLTAVISIAVAANWLQPPQTLDANLCVTWGCDGYLQKWALVGTISGDLADHSSDGQCACDYPECYLVSHCAVGASLVFDAGFGNVLCCDGVNYTRTNVQMISNIWCGESKPTKLFTVHVGDCGGAELGTMVANVGCFSCDDWHSDCP